MLRTISSFVEAGGDAPVLLDAAEHALNAISILIRVIIAGDLYVAVRLWRNDGFDFLVAQTVADAVSHSLCPQ